jgi:hypothetical protein
VLILLTGNYCFFNLLSILLCLLLLDDTTVAGFFPRNWLRRLQAIPLEEQPAPQQVSGPPPNPIEPTVPVPVASTATARFRRWPIQVVFPLTCIAVLMPAMQFAAMFRVRALWPGPMLTAYSWIAPFRSFNNYGLFAVMTTNRAEIIVQGSNDGVHWLDYEFKAKPGDLKRRPGFVEPHQPRLDWQMWFAALSDYRHNLWFVEFCVRLLNNSPQVLGLLERNPFPKAPPRYLRALVYEYHFTDEATRRKTGAWWRRQFKGEYVPVVSLPKNR